MVLDENEVCGCTKARGDDRADAVASRHGDNDDAVARCVNSTVAKRTMATLLANGFHKRGLLFVIFHRLVEMGDSGANDSNGFAPLGVGASAVVGYYRALPTRVHGCSWFSREETISFQKRS